ncbi:hypothetical protein OIO90_005985 [Microbotryomycetes sp. JL221]|nr:hypothetical protein OIO90_005985 [Microbotryomycetes sp. JL221]
MPESRQTRRVSLMHSQALLDASDALPSNQGRASLVYNLIDALELIDDSRDLSNRPQPQCRLVEPTPATKQQLCTFHDVKFVDALLSQQGSNSDSSSSASSSSTSNNSSDSDEDEDEDESGQRPATRRKRIKLSHMGLEHDCPMFDHLAQYVTQLAGAAIDAAKLLRQDEADVVINWHGGRHHAKRSQASGFCYIQDVGLSILELRRRPTPKLARDDDNSSDIDDPTTPPPCNPQRLSRVMYIDLDLHHGDGVEQAFYESKLVLTLSVHNHAQGFYPATGQLVDPVLPLHNQPRVPLHSLNIPLETGTSSTTLLRMFNTCIEPTFKKFNPDVIIVQCGCDGLANDPCQEWNLDLKGLGQIVEQILQWNKKTMLVGGGGYNHANVARCWAYLTSIALGRPFDLDDPLPSSLDEHTYQELSQTSPTLDVMASHKRDHNNEQTLNRIERAFKNVFKLMDPKSQII